MDSNMIQTILQLSLPTLILLFLIIVFSFIYSYTKRHRVSCTENESNSNSPVLSKIETQEETVEKVKINTKRVKKSTSTQSQTF